MDINPLDPRAPIPSAGARRRDESAGGFKGLMDLMSHLSAEAPHDDRQRAPEAPAASRTRGDRVREAAARESSSRPRADATARTDDTEESRPRRNRRAAEPEEPTSPLPVAPAVTAAVVAVPGAAVPAAPEGTATPNPAVDPAAAGPAIANAPAADPQAGASPQSATPVAAAAPSAPTATAPTAAAPTAAAAVPVPAPGAPAPDAPLASDPLAAQAAPATRPAAAAPVTQPVAGSSPTSTQAAATDQPASTEPAVDTAAQDALRSSGTRRVPTGAKVTVEVAPPAVRAQGVAPAGLVQAHLAANGAAGNATAPSAPGQPGAAGTLPQDGGLAGLSAQSGSNAGAQASAAQSNQAPLHAGGGQELYVGADDGNPQQGDGGQKNEAQQNGGQAGGGQAQAGSGFAFGAATIGQRGFGGDAARAQFQEILATRTARAPLQGTGQTAGGSQSTTALTAGPGGPQSMLTTAMASRAEATAQGRPGATPGTAVGQVAMKLASTAADGGGRVTIRLNPEELGKVDVKLELGRDGLVRASISAERPETLDMLQRDSRMLEKALQDAGLKTDQQSLSFDLRGGNGQPTDRDQGGAGSGPRTLASDDASGEPEITDATVADPAGIRADGSYDLVA